MAKDPAFLFYPNDWIGGTMGLNFEEKGAYMELLMMQFNRGHMTKDMIGQVLGHKFGQIWGQIEDKFSIDKDGLYFNERLEEEKIKRKKFVKSRINNRSGKNQYSSKQQKKGGHMTSHMENEDVNVNKDKIVFEKCVEKTFYDCLEFFPEHLHPKRPEDWMDAIDKLNRIDKVPFEKIVEITKRTRNDGFWSKNFLSLSKLRKKNGEGIPYIVVFNEQIKPKQTRNAGQIAKDKLNGLSKT